MWKDEMRWDKLGWKDERGVDGIEVTKWDYDRV